MMRLRKFRFLPVALLVASGVLFAAGGARAGTVDSLTYKMYFENLNFSGSYANYTYSLYRNSSPSVLSYVDMELPAELNLPPGSFSASGNSSIAAFMNSTAGPGISGEIFAVGAGDLGTKFGVGDTRYQVVKVNVPNPPNDFYIVLQIKAAPPSGKVFSTGSGMILIKSGNGSVTQSFAINTPAIVVPAPPPPPAVTIDSLYPNDFVMTADGMKPRACATLTFGATNASTYAVTSDSGGLINQGTPNANNSVSVCPPANNTQNVVQTTYTVTATGPGGTASDTAYVTVAPLVGLEPITLSATPQVVNLGDCSKLRWTTPNATFAFISNIDGGSVTTTPTANDCVVVCPRENTTYRLTAMRWNGTNSFVEATVTLLPDRLSPAPQTAQTLTILDVPPPPDGGWITFKILRDPVFGNITNVLVCGDADYNREAKAEGRRGCPSDAQFPGCCDLETSPGNHEQIVNCGSVSGGGVPECIMTGKGSPHFQKIVSGTIVKYYPYCRSGEISVKDALGKITECMSGGAVHSDP